MSAQTQPLATRHHDRVDLDVGHQVVENFGASDCWTLQTFRDWPVEERRKVADLLFSKETGIGLSCWRFNVGGGINPRIASPSRTAETFEVSEGVYDWTRQQTEQWFLAAAKERGVEQFLAFVNSPPGRMTRNGITFAEKDASSTNLKPGHEGQFARYLVDILEHFKTNPDERTRIDFDFVSPINEPQWGWDTTKQEGNRASNDDIKGVVRALHAQLTERRLSAAIVAPESGSIPDMWQTNGGPTKRYGAPYGDYADALLGDAEIAPMLSGRIAYHAYGSDRLDGEMVDHRLKLRQTMDKYPGVALWQSEYCQMEGPAGQGGNRRDLTIETALNVARLMHVDLTVANATAWQWWLAMSSVDYKDGLLYTDFRKPGDPPSIIPSKLLWAFGNYSRFVRPGMRRIELTGDSHDVRGLMGSAYKDEASRRVVAVYVNVSAEERTVDLTFDVGSRGWKLGSLVSYVTSDAPGDDLRRDPVERIAEGVKIPARSVVTFVSQFDAGGNAPLP